MTKFVKAIDHFGTAFMGASGAFLYLDVMQGDSQSSLETVATMFIGLSFWMIAVVLKPRVSAEIQNGRP